MAGKFHFLYFKFQVYLDKVGVGFLARVKGIFVQVILVLKGFVVKLYIFNIEQYDWVVGN